MDIHLPQEEWAYYTSVLNNNKDLFLQPRSGASDSSALLVFAGVVILDDGSLWVTSLQGLGLMGVDVTLRRGPPSHQILPQLLVSGG